MKTYEYYFGWDISKKTLNWALYDLRGQLAGEGQIDNKRSDIKGFLRATLQQYGVEPGQIFCLIEQTGLYGKYLTSEAYKLGLVTCVEDALRINKANQRQLDKSDPEDARMIGLYGFERAYRLKGYQPKDRRVLLIEGLQRRRRNLLKAKQSMAASLSYSLKWDEVDLEEWVVKDTKWIVQKITEVIENIDRRITDLIKEDEKLYTVYRRVRSVLGFGPKNTIVMLLETNFLRKITTAKSCINYAGLRPTRRMSGTSLNKRKRTSKKVNMALKTAFHTAAFAAIKSPYMRQYYDRKRAEGKTHLQVLNAIRNKLCRALYACHENQVMYEKKLQQTLVLS